MPESPIRKLVPYAEVATEKGLEVIHLNIGQPDIPSPKAALEAIKNYQEPVIAYSHSAGFASYRKGLANYYQKQGMPVESEDVLVTTGGSEAINMILNAVMDPEDELIIPEPFYANYNGFSIAAGVNIRPVVSGIKSGFALPSVDNFEALINPKTKAILICNPGNPTGYLYSKEEIQKLAAIAKKHDLFLIADEVYREFTYDGVEHYSILQEEGLEENAIIGGAGSAVVESLAQQNLSTPCQLMGIPDRYIEHASPAEQFNDVGIDPAAIISKVETLR